MQLGELVETVQNNFDFGTGRNYKSPIYNANESEIISSGIERYLEFDMLIDTFARNIPTYRLIALRKQDPRNIQYGRRTKGNIRNYGMNFYFQSMTLLALYSKANLFA